MLDLLEVDQNLSVMPLGEEKPLCHLTIAFFPAYPRQNCRNPRKPPVIDGSLAWHATVLHKIKSATVELTFMLIVRPLASSDWES